MTRGKRDSGPPPLHVEYFADIRPVLNGQWRIKRVLPASGLALLYGDSGTFKTFLALDWGFHVATDRPWHGRPVGSGAVVYVGAEGGGSIGNRIEALRRHYRADDAPIAIIRSPINLFDSDADPKRLSDAIRDAGGWLGIPIALVIIDTVSQTLGSGKENSDDMAAYMGNCLRVAAEFDALVLAIHHRSGDATNKNPRGHTSIRANVDTLILLERAEGSTTCSATIKKQRDGEDGLKFAFDTEKVVIGEDEDGQAVSSLVVVPAADLPQPAGRSDPFEGITQQHVRQIQAKIADGYGHWRKDFRSSQWAGIAIAEVLGLDLADDSHKARVKALLTEWTKEGGHLGIEELPDANYEKRKCVVVLRPIDAG